MTQRIIVQIDNMLFVTTDLAKGGAGSGNFSHSGREGLRGGSGGGGTGAGGGGASFNFNEQASMGVYQTKKGNTVYDPTDIYDPKHPEDYVPGDDKATDVLSLKQLRQMPDDKVISVKQYDAKRGGSRRSTVKVGSLALKEEDLPK